MCLRNLLISESHELKNRYLHIEWSKHTHLDEAQHVEQHIPHSCQCPGQRKNKKQYRIIV